MACCNCGESTSGLGYCRICGKELCWLCAVRLFDADKSWPRCPSCARAKKEPKEEAKKV